MVSQLKEYFGLWVAIDKNDIIALKADTKEELLEKLAEYKHLENVREYFEVTGDKLNGI